MKKNGIFVAVALVASLLFSACAGKTDSNGWYNDFDEAKKAAKLKNKNILLFVHSDYDVPGTEIGVAAITTTPEFSLALEDEYVCVHFAFVDLPKIMGGPDANATGAEQKAAEKKRNDMQKQFAVADVYAVQETPSIVLISKDGYFITNVTADYKSDSAMGYASLVKAEDGIVADFNKKIQATEKGSAKERIAAIDAIFESSSESQRLALVDMSRKLVELDAKDEFGLVSKHLFAIANSEAFNKINDMDFDGAVKTYTKYASDKRIKPADAQALYFMAASTIARSGSNNVDQINEYLQKSIDVAPESESVENIRNIMKNLTQMQEQQEAEIAAEKAARHAAEQAAQAEKAEQEAAEKTESAAE